MISGPPISVLAFGVDLYLARGRFVVRGVVLQTGKKSGVVLQFSLLSRFCEGSNCAADDTMMSSRSQMMAADY